MSPLGRLFVALLVATLSFSVVASSLHFIENAVRSHSVKGDPEANYTPIELIRAQHYPAEAHWATTPDGYILGMQRIPYGRNQTNNGSRPVIFLQHGLLCSSTNWISNLANESLGFILAQAGFDVWLGNIRGNTYSRNHTHLSPKQKEFWNFTWDQHALIDLPTMVNYVLNHTKADKLFYVGHSQGTVMGFAGFTADKILASKIKAFFALAPVATVKYVEGAFKYLAEFYPILEILLDTLGTGEFFPNDRLLDFLAQYVCPFDHDTDELCKDVLYLICGFDPNKDNINSSRVPVYYSHTPAGTSVKNCAHFAQEVISGNFQMYNYGSKEENAAHYHGMTSPPMYNVSDLTVPTALFSGGQDWLADKTDVANLIKMIPSHLLFNHTYIDSYDHLDFIWGLNAADDVYKVIVKLVVSGAWKVTSSKH